MATARDLCITSWARESSDPSLTLAVPGLKFTGWWPGTPPETSFLQRLELIWPRDSGTFRYELDIQEDVDERKHQLCAYVRIREYPVASWLLVVAQSLQLFVTHGAAIAWAGGWECFLRYTPTQDLVGCYAAYTATTGFVCLCDLDEPFRYLDEANDVVRGLHEAVRQTVVRA